jgi:hypothetical protein
MVLALVARPGSKTLDDNLADDDSDLLNFATMEFEIVCRMSSRLQMCWPDLGKADYSGWYFGWSDFYDPLTPTLSSLYLVMRMSKVAFGR